MKPKVFFYILVGLNVLFVAVGGAGYYLATAYTARQTTALRQRLSDQTILDDQIQQLTSLRHQYQKISAQVPLVDSALPRDKNEAQIVLQLERLAQASGISFSGVSFPPTSTLPNAASQTTPSPAGLAVTLTLNQLSGSYAQIQSFLQSIEHLNRYANVTSLSLNGNGSTIGFDLTLNVYLKP